MLPVDFDRGSKVPLELFHQGQPKSVVVTDVEGISVVVQQDLGILEGHADHRDLRGGAGLPEGVHVGGQGVPRDELDRVGGGDFVRQVGQDVVLGDDVGEGVGEQDDGLGPQGLFLGTAWLGTHTWTMSIDVTDIHGDRAGFASGEEVQCHFL